MNAVYVHEPVAPAPASVLPAEMLEAAAGLADGVAAVLAVNGVDDRDAAAVFGDVWVRCVQLVAISWRRSGQLSSDGAAPPVGGVVHSERVDATTVDSMGRVNPGNLAAVAALARRFHADAAVCCGLVTWTVPNGRGGSFREVAVPGDFAVESGEGTYRVIHPEG